MHAKKYSIDAYDLDVSSYTNIPVKDVKEEMIIWRDDERIWISNFETFLFTLYHIIKHNI